MRLVLLFLILTVVTIAGCTQATNDAMYVCKNGTMLSTPCNDVVSCTPVWNCTNWTNCSTSGTQMRNCTDSKKCKTPAGMPMESQTCAPTVPSRVYTETDVDLAVNAGKVLLDASAWEDFYNSYTAFEGTDSYMIKTPYFMAVSYVRSQVMRDNVISYAAVRDSLGMNNLSVLTLTTTDDYYSSNNTRNLSVVIRDANRTYKASFVRATSEKSADFYDTNYRTTINATNIPGFEDYAKKTVYLVIIANRSEIRYKVEMGRFK